MIERRTHPRKAVLNRIAILDDCEGMIEAYKMRLGEFVRIIDCAMTLNQLYELLDKNQYDYVILDYVLPCGFISDHIKEIAGKANGAKLLIATGFDIEEVRSSVNGEITAIFSKDDLSVMYSIMKLDGLVETIGDNYDE